MATFQLMATVFPLNTIWQKPDWLAQTQNKETNQKDTPFMLGGRADIYLHTPASERRPCT